MCERQGARVANEAGRWRKRGTESVLRETLRGESSWSLPLLSSFQRNAHHILFLSFPLTQNFTPLDSPALSPHSTPGPSTSLVPGGAHNRAFPKATSDASRPLLIKLKSSKSARAYKQSYSSGPPLVPAFVFDRVMEYVGKIKFAKKNVFVNAVCRYWSLKREARRGAPLLKRLHLEVRFLSSSSR